MNTFIHNHQSGSALIVSLILLVLLTILGVSTIQNTTMQEVMSGNTKELHRSFHAAEIGLRHAEEAATGTVACGNDFVGTFLGANNPTFTDLPANGDELAARYRSGFCGPMIREITSESGIDATSDLAGQNRIIVRHYIVVSVGEVPGNAQTQLVSTFAKQ